MSVDWELTTLAGCSENLDKLRKPITKSKREAGSIPYYGASGIVDHVANYIFDEDLLLVSEDGANLLARTYPIAFSISGKTWVNNHAHVLRFSDRSTQKFVEYYLNSISLEPWVSGMAQPKLNQTKLNEIPIPLPPLPEQIRIVAILDEAFASIDQAKANTERNLANARELFDSYLNRVFEEKGEGWEKSAIKDVISFIDYRGRTPQKTESGMRLITAKNVKMGFLQPFPEEYVDPEIYDSWMTRGIPRKGDVLFTTEAPLGNVAQLDTSEQVVFAQRVIIMQPDRNILRPKFLRFALMPSIMQSRIHENGTGATAKGIKAKVLKSIEVPYPCSLSVQEQLENLFEKCWESKLELVDRFERKLNTLGNLKQSILKKAFTGELTSNPDKVLNEAGV